MKEFIKIFGVCLGICLGIGFLVLGIFIGGLWIVKHFGIIGTISLLMVSFAFYASIIIYIIRKN